MSSIFGGSYPPGCNNVPADDEDSEQETADLAVNWDEAFSVTSGEDSTADDPEVDAVYFQVFETAPGQWYLSADLDCNSGRFTDSLTKEDGPYTTENEAIKAGLAVATNWMQDNGYTHWEYCPALHLNHLAELGEFLIQE